MDAESTEFEKLFLSLVVPDLRKRCRFVGSQIALELLGFEEAVSIVWDEARRRGALRLPQQRLDGLEKWVVTSIFMSEEEFRPSVLEQRIIVDNVASDIAITESRRNLILEGRDDG